MPSDPLIVIARLADVFDQLGIPYFVGGSLASSVYGIPRATNDADLVADIKRTHVQPLKEALEGDFYVAEELILDAIRRRSSFNVIHLSTMFKADVFIPKGDSLSHEEMARARTETIHLADGTRAVRFASPEGTILQKLLWYRLGGHVSSPLRAPETSEDTSPPSEEGPPSRIASRINVKRSQKPLKH